MSASPLFIFGNDVGGFDSSVRFQLDQNFAAVRPTYFIRGSGGLVDDTAAVMAAFTAAKAASLYFNLVFEGIFYTTSQFIFTDSYYSSFDMRGAAFVGGSVAVPFDSVVKFINCDQFKVFGAWAVTADSHFTGPAGNVNMYANGVYFTTTPGGTFGPIITYTDIAGLTVHHALNGIKVGERNNDSQMSELNFHGCMTLSCPSGITVSGSQAIVTFNGCVIGSQTPTDCVPPMVATVFQTALSEGSDIVFNGGEVIYFSAPAGNSNMNIQPAQTATFSNPYGSIQVNSAEVETTGILVSISNPLGLASPLSDLSGLSLVNCKGYFGGAFNLPVVKILDAGWSGIIAIPEGSFFYNNAGVRTVAHIDASLSPNAKIEVGKTCFSVASGFLDWMNGVSGGQLIHALETGIVSYAGGGITQPSGNNPIVWNQPLNTGIYSRYGAWLNQATGVITVGSNAPRILKIQASLLTGASNNTGNIFVQDITNGRVISYGVITGGVASVCGTVVSPSPGQQFSVNLNIPASVALNGAVTNNVIIDIGT